MLTLSLLEAHWLDSPEPLDDQCAHGTVRMSVGEHVLVSPEDGEFTVSAAALSLLRTLDHDHTPNVLVAEGSQLFPCCGFNVWLAGDRFPVLVVGCPSGVDMEIVHRPAGVAICGKGVETIVPDSAWRNAVVSFARSVLAFYEREPPRNPIADANDREGWQAFWEEYADRLKRHDVAI